MCREPSATISDRIRDEEKMTEPRHNQQLASNMIIIIDSHKLISEKRNARTRCSGCEQAENCHLFNRIQDMERAKKHSNSDSTNCQVMNCYHAATIIYILLHLLLIGTTSSQATSQIRSIWVSSEDLHQEQLKTHSSAESILRRPPPPISSERRVDFEQTNAGSMRTQHKVESAGGAKSNESTAGSSLHASASSLQPVAIEPETGDHHQSSHQQQVAQRRSSQPIAGHDNSPHHKTRSSHFEIASHPIGSLTNHSDELATSLDRQWLRQNHIHNPLMSTNMNTTSASVTNAQVHFDEDSRDQHYNHNQLGASRLYTIDTNDRRQDTLNATESPASNYAPKHETFEPSQEHLANKTASQREQTHNLNNIKQHGPAYSMSGDNYENDDDLANSFMLNNRTASLTFTRDARPHAETFSQHAQKDLRSPPAPVPIEQPVIYYLPDGDKWNQPAPEEHNHLGNGERLSSYQHSNDPSVAYEDSRRHRRRPTHGNGDSFVFPPVGSDGTTLNDMTRTRIQNDLIGTRALETDHWPSSGSTSQVYPEQQQLINQPQLSYGFVQHTQQPGHLFHGSSQVHQMTTTTTTPMPTVYPANQFAQDLSAAMKEQIYLSQYANPTAVAPPPLTTFELHQPRRQASPTILPQTLHQFISGGGGTYNYLPVPPRGHNNNQPRVQVANRVINLGEAPAYAGQFSAEASGPKTSLFRNYSPMHLIAGGKTKKSLLSTINDKLNTWTGSASDSDVRHLIENSFYEQHQNDQTTRRRKRPAMGQSSSGSTRNRNTAGHNHLLAAHHGYSGLPPPLPPMYAPIRQPTVAPASSSLRNFYGGQHHASASANNNHRAQHNQNPGSQQQAANFIPVVAVQVTRTSPAPHALDASFHQADKLDDQQNTADSLSANEIDEYLASRTGHLSVSKQHQAMPTVNLNDKQKWDDSYGSSAAASTGQRYQNGPYHPRTSRRRHVINSSPARPLPSPSSPQHETTIKSAVFGYLPHQADAPLLQAMNMLQQLPAGQVQHHHHHQQQTSPAVKQLAVDQTRYSGELYANQMDKSQQSVEAATPPLDYQSLAAVAAAAAAAATANQQHQQQPFQAQPFQVAGPDEQPMSLALQLQANNYLQNDIAHPFGSQMPSATHQRVASSKHAPLDVIYPTSGGSGTDPAQLHYPAFQFNMSPSQFGAYQEQLSQIVAQNPLLMSQNSQQGDQSPGSSQHAHHPFQGYNSKHSDFPTDNHLLAAAPNDLNPLLMSPLFYQNQQHHGAFSPANQFYNLYHQQSVGNSDQHDTASNSHDDTDQSASPGAAGQDSSVSGDQDSQATTAPSGEGGSQRNQGTLSSKGKKRSSDFFANAGQLLLSALPLLLAPTLGLMFASSPANPAARFHGSQLASQASGGLSGGSSLGLGQSHGGFSSGMLDDGLVMNASPAPQLFTPSPPGGQYAAGGSSATSASNYAPDSSFPSLLMDRFNETFGGDGDQTATVAPPPLLTTAATTSSTSATSKPPNQYYKTSNSLSALTGFRLDKPTRNRFPGSGGLPNRSATSSTTTNRPFAIIVTTLGPQPPAAGLNESTYSSDHLNSSAGGAGDIGQFGRNRTAPTILVLESHEESDPANDDDGDEKADQASLESRRQPNSTTANQQQADDQSQIRRSSSAPAAMTTRVPSSTIIYDIGYEGADFDAQFATLRKNSSPHKSVYLTTFAPVQLANERKPGHNHVKDKNHYQYDEPPSLPSRRPTAESVDTQHKDSNRFDDLTPDDSSASSQQENSKLYPVSSWPPMRRKTVSLITSSGNKTLLDSSDRYVGLMAATGVNGHSRNRVAQNSKRNKLSGAGSESQQLNNSALVVGQPSQQAAVIYDDEQPLAVHRQTSPSSRLEPANSSNLAERRHSPLINSIGSATTTTTRQQLNKKRLNTLDNFVVESLRSQRRRKRDLSSGPLEEPASANLINFPGQGESSSGHQVKSQPKQLKATGQVVKLKNKSRKLLRRVKKRIKLIERRQDSFVADHYSPQNGTTDHLMYAINQTDSQFPPVQDLRHPQHHHHQQQPVNMTTTYEPGPPAEETLRRDASKSKSAIVTAMITHVADGADDRDQDKSSQALEPASDDSAELWHEELREQLLAKKLLLDRLATRTGATAAASATDELNYLRQTDEERQLDAPTGEFNAGGRGRFKPVPVLDYHSPYGGPDELNSPELPQQQQQQQNFSATRFINNRAAMGSRNKLMRSRNVMGELNEDTKRALAKFGTLLLEDTLEQLPPTGGRNESRRSYPAQTRKRSLSRSRYANTPPAAYSPAGDLGPFLPATPTAAGHSYDNYESGSATERYSTRATQAPLPLTDDVANSGWSRHYSNERANANVSGYYDQHTPRDHHNRDPLNYTRPADGRSPPTAELRNDRTLTYQYPHGRARAVHNYQSSSGDMSEPQNASMAELDAARYEHFDSARTSGSANRQQQLTAYDSYAPGSGQRELGVGSQAVAFKTQGGAGSKQSLDGGSPINKYNNFLKSHLVDANATGPVRHYNSSSSSPPDEQLDARYSTYSNYSTVAPAYHHDHRHHDHPSYAHNLESHPHDLAHYHHHQHPDDRYRDMPPAEYPPHGDSRAPRTAQYPSHENGHYGAHNSTYPPAPPPLPSSPGTGHYDHQYRHPPTSASHHQATANYPESYRDRHHHQRQSSIMGDEYPPTQPPVRPDYQSDMSRGPHASRAPYSPDHPSARYYSHSRYNQPQYEHHHGSAHHHHSSSSTTYAPASSSHHLYGERAPPPGAHQHQFQRGDSGHYDRHHQHHPYDPTAAASRSTESTKAVNDYLKRVQFSDSDRDKLMASYLTCDGLLNDNDHCLERLSCEFSDPQNIEKANKLDRAVSSILLGHILINTYIPKAFKLRLKSASLFGYTQSGKCSKFACSKLTTRQSSDRLDPTTSTQSTNDDTDAKSNNTDR